MADLYERMRAQVLNGFGGRGGAAGLGILMSQGMGAWILRCREFSPVVVDAGRHDTLATPIAVPPLETQVAAMIAAMILNRSKRELP